MKIAIITDHLRGGGKERRMVELMKGLLAENDRYKFIIIMMDGKSEEDIAYKYILDCKIPIFYLGEMSRVKQVLMIYSICKNEQVDLVHFWAPIIYGYFLAPIRLILNIPMISSTITSARKQGGNKFWLCKPSYLLFDKILSNSYQALKINEVPSQKAICIYNGFDPCRSIIKTSVEDVRLRYNIDTTYIVSMAGEYSARKDYPLFVEAANQVLAHNSDITFLAMGSGDATPYEALILPENKNRIRFIGRVTDVESVYNASDVVVLATTVEGVSNAIMEGMALGKPIVSTKGPYVGTEEVVEDGKSGFLTEYHDVNTFANYILQLLSDDDLRIRMGMRGKQIIQEKFGIEQMIHAFAKVYDEIIG
jgi:glycosyltransferase involved in cell wall biosynthesis